MRGFIELLREPGFVGHTIVGALAMSAMFAYIVGSPFVFIKLYGVPATHFGFLFGLNAMGLIGGSQLNARLLKSVPPERILHWALFMLMVSTLVLLAAGYSRKTQLAWLLAPLFVVIASLGLVMPNTVALALRGQAERAGVASALMGSLQFLIFGIAAAAVSVMHDGTAQPMTGTMAVCGLGAWWVHRWLRRR